MARLAGGATNNIHTASLTVGGGKNQAYIQHVRTVKQAAALKISHKALIQELLPKCQVPGTTKGDVLKARDDLFQKYAK